MVELQVSLPASETVAEEGIAIGEEPENDDINLDMDFSKGKKKKKSKSKKDLDELLDKDDDKSADKENVDDNSSTWVGRIRS